MKIIVCGGLLNRKGAKKTTDEELIDDLRKANERLGNKCEKYLSRRHYFEDELKKVIEKERKRILGLIDEIEKKTSKKEGIPLTAVLIDGEELKARIEGK